MRVEMTERRCPKCGAPMYLLPDTDTTTWGVRTVDLICEECLHVETVTTVVAAREEDECR
jgi:hypothetical protein